MSAEANKLTMDKLTIQVSLLYPVVLSGVLFVLVAMSSQSSVTQNLGFGGDNKKKKESLEMKQKMLLYVCLGNILTSFEIKRFPCTLSGNNNKLDDGSLKQHCTHHM